jgi:hypothetical protein
METLLLVCAGLGGTLLVLQLLAGLLGIGGDHVETDHDVHDTGTDHESSEHWYLGFFTFRALVGALTFFGLGGLTAQYYELPPKSVLAAAVLSGAVAMYLIASVMNFFKRLKSDGTVKVENAVGEPGVVYLRIPAEKTGPGKVTLKLQNRSVELEAYTTGRELPTGSPIRVTNVLATGAVEVVAHHEG